MKFVSVILVSSIMVLLIGCYPTTPRTYQGAGAGAVLGGIAGGLISGWKGAVIGGILGAVAGATITEIAAHAAREAVLYNRPVEYTADNGRYLVRSDPERYDEGTKCHKVRERIWEDGRLVKDQVKEVCESTRYER